MKKNNRSIVKGVKRPRVLPVVLAALMLCSALGSCGRGSDRPGDGAAVLREAKYPERTAYPNTEDGFDFDEELYERWREERTARQLESEDLDKVNAYVRSVLPELLSSDGGGVCSPMNIYVALSMLAETAGGRSREQILDLLGAGSVEEQRELTKNVWNAIYNDDGTYSSVLANSLWLRSADAGEYSGETLQTLAQDYYASTFAGEMGSDEFNGLLRDWLNGHTSGLLQEQVGNIFLNTNTVMALASTAYFGDRWGAEFNADDTETGIFHSPEGDVEREFMHKTTRGNYYWGDGFAGVELSFERGGSMRFLLPEEGADMDEILRDETALDFLTEAYIPESVQRRELVIHLSLPKFDIVSDGDIKPKLMALGVTDVFDPEMSDFTPLIGEDNRFDAGGTESWQVWVDRVLHGARVSVDEEGCEAAAYTVIIMFGAGAARPEEVDEIDLDFDRPFVFSLMSGEMPVFAGVMAGE